MAAPRGRSLLLYALTARITTENTSLKQRVRQLTADNRMFEERLAAVRSTLRF
ncbi:hypothetical protein [Micromonospora sp. KC207]|uniref:hypothetical protein n=1 Tax=Micromonospora sp. KC207 TaxID=2530377 RepID=UPI001404DE2F|nr:hypothetical protein [Micromonospora sp. KC207]